MTANHDRINLGRLVKRLEKSVEGEDWSQDGGHNTWIKTQGTLQKVKHARMLLKNVEADDPDPYSPKSAQRYRDLRIALDRTEEFILAVDKPVAPKQVRPAPILSSIPIPSMIISLPTVSPSKLTKSTTTATPNFMQNSTALQQELSDQLAQMATQLKRNAIHFSDSLAKDQAVVEDAQMKIEGNYDVMQRERLRVRDLRGTTGSTTCLVVMSVVAVLVAFIVMVLVIRTT